METTLIWLITAAVFIAIFIPYFIKFRRKQKADIARKREAESIGMGRPRSQYPQIDNAACIGCGSCVEACPEGDVLGVVFGKATIINGDRCVGHGYCEQVCPVGALKVGLGDIKSRDDIPITDEYNETTVKGLYIAGELGGISLIRNAITQGKTVIERLCSAPFDTGSTVDYDVAIVGGGPAGLSAALTAVQNNLNYVVFDQQEPGGTILQYPRRKLVMTQPVEIPLYGKLDKPEYSKETLLQTWTEVINQHHVNIMANTEVEAVRKVDDYFEITSSQGTYKSRYVVLAMGRRGTPRKLEVPGEDLPKVMYQLIDAQSYNGNNLLVVGGGDSAIEAAVGLARQDNNKVHISYRKPKFFRIKKKNEERVNDLIRNRKIIPLFNSNVTEIKAKSVVLEMEGKAIEIDNDYVFVFAGGIPPFKMLKEMGIKFGGEMKSLQPAGQ